jgi:hypothetical protein
MDAANDDDLDPGYDADQAPDPAAWLGMNEHARLDAVRRHHDRGPHPPAPSPEAHHAFHVVVENQIAVGSPPAAAETLNRLIAEGLSRHEAVHALAGAASRRIFEMLKHKAPFDDVAYASDLGQMTAAGWLASAAQSPASASPRKLASMRKRRPRR